LIVLQIRPASRTPSVPLLLLRLRLHATLLARRRRVAARAAAEAMVAAARMAVLLQEAALGRCRT